MPRHHDIGATFGPRGFEAYRGPRRQAHHDCGTSCSCRTQRPAMKRAPVNDTAAEVVTKLQGMARKVVKSASAYQRMSDSLDRLDGAIGGARAAMDYRRATGFRGRV